MVTLYVDHSQTYGYSGDMVVPHGSYLMNLGSPEPETRAKSCALLLDELQRCQKLGLPLFNFHPGESSTGGYMDSNILCMCVCVCVRGGGYLILHSSDTLGAILQYIRLVACRWRASLVLFEIVGLILKCFAFTSDES